MIIEEEVATAVLEGGYWWERFEYQPCPNEWRSCMSAVEVYKALVWNTRTLRKMQPQIEINGVLIPEPVRKPLKYDTNYWLVDITTDGLRGPLKWEGDSSDNLWLRNGLIHLSEEAAQAHYDALVRANNA